MYQTQWQGEHDPLPHVFLDEVLRHWKDLNEKIVEFEEVFFGVNLGDTPLFSLVEHFYPPI